MLFNLYTPQFGQVSTQFLGNDPSVACVPIAPKLFYEQGITPLSLDYPPETFTTGDCVIYADGTDASDYRDTVFMTWFAKMTEENGLKWLVNLAKSVLVKTLAAGMSKNTLLVRQGTFRHLSIADLPNASKRLLPRRPDPDDDCRNELPTFVTSSYMERLGYPTELAGKAPHHRRLYRIHVPPKTRAQYNKTLAELLAQNLKANVPQRVSMLEEKAAVAALQDMLKMWPHRPSFQKVLADCAAEAVS